MFRFDRSSGILLHPTSLPGPDGIGDLGDGALHFVDWLARAKQGWWQVLPLNPVGPGNSPYASPSAFALNPLLISLDRLVEQGALAPDEITGRDAADQTRVDYASVIRHKIKALKVAFQHAVVGSRNLELIEVSRQFAESHRFWLDDFALFMALKDEHGGMSWQEWELPLRVRDRSSLDAARVRLQDEIEFHAFTQAIAYSQWSSVRQYATDRDIRLIGDIPIFVALDSADVWANQSLFRLDEHASPLFVSGVPPDLFTDDGQLWGNPVYDWQEHARSGFQWWTDRVKAVNETVDMIRIDHFRGLAAAWIIPADAANARPGRWERGPGKAVFDAIETATGDLPMIAEDLGLITQDVHDLRNDLALPGMKVLQFAFGGDSRNVYLPHNYENRSVVYTGTHDNQTTIGWFTSQPEHVQNHVRSYVGSDCADVAWDLIRLAQASVSDLAIAPLQDIFRQDDADRMNAPGTATGNWEWRFHLEQLDPALADGYGMMSETYGRTPTDERERQYDQYDYSAPETRHRLYEPGA